ncbi:hypothetical protein BBJ28_00016192 [Nothophytophthora sp. Chile5]|nr:hypothetical protein BBJ28_00016192 [Nothophytophthora sp. Chile5]
MAFKKSRRGAPKAPFTSPYPSLMLSVGEKKQLQQLAKDLVTIKVDEYEEFLYDNHGKLPPSKWKFFRRDQQVETYLRRGENCSSRGFGATRTFRSGSDVTATARSTSTTYREELGSLDVADIRSIGSRDGTVEDAIYGVMGPTTETMRYKSAYIRDGVEDCSVLAVIDNVTEAKPFTSLTIRWKAMENPPLLRKVLKSYDHVYLDATGFTRLSSGERVAFHLVHSVDFQSAARPLPNFTRSQVASIEFWRQTGPKTVEFHGHCLFSLPFERTRSFLVPVISTALAKSLMHSLYASQMKKLRWAVRERKMEMLFRPDWSANRACTVCTKKRLLHKGVSCDLCGEPVCKPCRVSHKVASVELDNSLHWMKVHVCPFCMLKVTNSNPAETVRSEIMTGEYGPVL